MQQKRKRQYVMPVRTDNDFFAESVFLMEYGRTVIDDKKNGLASSGKKSVVIPIFSFKNEYSISGPNNKNSKNKQIILRNNYNNNNKNENVGNEFFDDVNVGLKVTTQTANSQYFLENLVQSVLTYITLKNKGEEKKYSNRKLAVKSDINNDNNQNDKIELLDTNELSSISVILGGDGRIFNSQAIEIATRVCSGNNLKSVILSDNSFLTTASALSELKSVNSKSVKTQSEGTSCVCLLFFFMFVCLLIHLLYIIYHLLFINYYLLFIIYQLLIIIHNLLFIIYSFICSSIYKLFIHSNTQFIHLLI
jgi:hypothetical protein